MKMIKKEELKKELERLIPLEKKPSFVLGVSGGVDSMTLLDLFRRLGLDISVVHINHELREASKQEEDLIKAYCSNYQIELEVIHWPKDQHPENGIEEAARKFRYQAFEKVAKEKKSSYIVTAHHLNDRIETFLMRMVKGGRRDRLDGLQKRRPFFHSKELTLLRPLLSFPKEELYDYAKKEKLPYLEDESNQELTYTRNRFRNVYLPQLQKENPNFLKDLERLLDQQEGLLSLAKQTIQNNRKQYRIEIGQDKGMRLDFLSELPDQQKIFYLLDFLEWNDKEELRSWSQKGEKAFFSFLNKEGNGEWDLPQGYYWLKEGKVLWLKKRKEEKVEEALLLTTTFQSFSDGQVKIIPKPDEPLFFRKRRPGDFLIRGKIHQKLRRYWINQKISREIRASTYVLASKDQRVLALWQKEKGSYYLDQTFKEHFNLQVLKKDKC